MNASIISTEGYQFFSWIRKFLRVEMFEGFSCLSTQISLYTFRIALRWRRLTTTKIFTYLCSQPSQTQWLFASFTTSFENSLLNLKTQVLNVDNDLEKFWHCSHQLIVHFPSLKRQLIDIELSYTKAPSSTISDFQLNYRSILRSRAFFNDVIWLRSDLDVIWDALFKWGVGSFWKFKERLTLWTLNSA